MWDVMPLQALLTHSLSSNEDHFQTLPDYLIMNVKLKAVTVVVFYSACNPRQAWLLCIEDAESHERSWDR